MKVSAQSSFDLIPSNRELIQRYVTAGDQAAFVELVQRFGPMVLGVARRLLHDRDDAEDAMQLAFVELGRRAGTIENPDHVGSWLHTVTVHIAYRLRRRRPSHEPLVSEPIDPRLSLDEVSRRSDCEILSEELDRLPADWREPLVLRYFAGLSNEEAAIQLGVSIAAIEGRLKRGKNSLRVRLLRRGVAVASLFAMVGPARFADAAETTPLDSDVWSSVTDAASDLAADPTVISFQPPMEAAPMMTPVLTMKAFLMTSTAAVILAFLGSDGDGSAPQGQASLSTVAAAESGEASAGNDSLPPAATVELSLTEPATGESAKPDVVPPGIGDVFGVGDENGGVASAFDDDPFGTTDTRPQAGSSNADRRELPGGPQPFRAAPTQQSAQQIRARMESGPPVQFDCLETPLTDSLEFLAEYTGVPIWLNEASLADVGIASDEPVTANMTFANLADALKFVLCRQGLDADYIVRDGYIEVTSIDEAENAQSTRRYDLPSSIDASSVVDELEQHVGQTERGDVSWVSLGGRGIASIVEVSGRPTLIVTQSDRGHEGVAHFLELLAQPGDAVSSRPSATSGMSTPVESDVADEPPPAVSSTPTNSGVEAVIAYDLAHVSQLLYSPQASGEQDEEYGYGGGDGGYGGGGYPGGGYPGAGMGMGGFASRPKLISLDDLRLLTQVPIEATVAVQRGSQLLVRADEKNHALIRQAIEDLESMLKSVGPPTVPGETRIEQPKADSPKQPQELPDHLKVSPVPKDDAKPAKKRGQPNTSGFGGGLGGQAGELGGGGGIGGGGGGFF